jgi:hypothetical protein
MTHVFSFSPSRNHVGRQRAIAVGVPFSASAALASQGNSGRLVNVNGT